MKNILVVLMIFAAGLTSCSEPISKIDWNKYRGTQWKLSYVHLNMKRDSINSEAMRLIDPYNRVMDNRTMLEPKDCATCYTLTFDAKRTGYLTFVSIQNIINVQLPPHSTIPITLDIGTDLDEPYDGNLFSNLLKSTQHIVDGAGVHVLVGDSTRRTCFFILFFEQIEP